MNLRQECFAVDFAVDFAVTFAFSVACCLWPTLVLSARSASKKQSVSGSAPELSIIFNKMSG